MNDRRKGKLKEGRKGTLNGGSRGHRARKRKLRPRNSRSEVERTRVRVYHARRFPLSLFLSVSLAPSTTAALSTVYFRPFSALILSGVVLLRCSPLRSERLANAANFRVIKQNCPTRKNCETDSTFAFIVARRNVSPFLCLLFFLLVFVPFPPRRDEVI